MKEFEFVDYFQRGDWWMVRVVYRWPNKGESLRHTSFYETISEQSAQALCWCLMGEDAPTKPIEMLVQPNHKEE